MSAELAPVTSIEDHREKPDKNDSEVHPVKDSVESRPETKELMIGFEREKMRDRDAIQTFIKTRDILWNGGHSQRTLDQAIYEAAIAYDAIMITPLDHWEAEPVEPKPPVDLQPAITSGNRIHSLSLPEVKSPLSDDVLKKIAEEKLQAESNVRDRYKGERSAKDAMDLKRKEYEAIKRHYRQPVDQKTVTITDERTYTDKDGNPQTNTIKGQTAFLEDQLDALTPAIDASSAARKAALADGKSLDEADRLGVEAYQKGLQEYKDKLKAMAIESGEIQPDKREEGQQEARAIDAFNNVRDAYVSPSMRHGKFQHGWTLHNAAYAYEESLHIAHAGHDEHGEHTEEHGHTEHSHSHSGTSSPDLISNSDPNSATSPEAETQPDKKKIGKVLGKIGHAITREHRVLTSREFDQAGKSPTGMGEYGMNGDDYVLSLTEDIQPKWFKEWKAKAETRKNERKARKNQVRDQRQTQKDQRNDQLDQEVAKRLATIRESKWRREGVDLIKDIRRYNRSKNQANDASKDEKEQ